MTTVVVHSFKYYDALTDEFKIGPSKRTAEEELQYSVWRGRGAPCGSFRRLSRPK